MGDKGLSVFLGNLLLQNPTIASSALPQIEITVVNPGLGSTGTGSGNPAADISSTIANLSRVPLTGNVERDLSRIAAVLPNLRFTVSSPLGNTTFVLPKGASLGDIQTLLSNLTSLADSATLANVFHAENPAAAVLTLGSHAVFTPNQPHLAQTALPIIHQNVLPDSRGGATVSQQGSSAEARFAPAVSSDLQVSVSRSAESPLFAKSGVSQEAIKLPEVVRDVLVSLRILPPGVSTEQALPRLQEVVRLWTAGGAQHADLPADVVKVVSNFLASAVLATTLASTAPGATPLRAGQSPELQRGVPNGLNFGGTPTFGEGARPGFQFGPLTRSDIASAVLSALSGSPTLLPSTNGAKSSLPGGVGETIHNGTALPGSNDAQGKPQGDKNAAAGRIVEGARGEAGLDRGIRDLKSGQTRISGDEHRERGLGEEIDLEGRRSAHDQESHHAGAGDQEDASVALEALWTDLHSALERAGFIEAGTLRRLLDAVEARSFLRVLAAKVPDGLDLIDVLNLVDSRIGLSPESGGVNAALRRLSDYRTQGRKDKASAVMEPLRDAFVVMDMIDADLMPVHEAELSLEDLKGFETFASIAQLLLDHPAWLSRTGMTAEDRRDLERLIPDVDRLIENVHERFELFERALHGPESRGPEYFRDTIPALPH